MTSSSGALPAALLELLSGNDLDGKVGQTFLLLTASRDGWPRLALLSVGEVVAIGPRDLRLALYPASTTTANLTRTRKGTLVAFLPGAAHYVELTARRLDDLRTPHAALAHFAAQVRSARVDAVGYAELIGGVSFRLRDTERTIQRWRETVAALRGAESGPSAV